jgi:hypothetical protein
MNTKTLIVNALAIVAIVSAVLLFVGLVWAVIEGVAMAAAGVK